MKTTHINYRDSNEYANNQSASILGNSIDARRNENDSKSSVSQLASSIDEMCKVLMLNESEKRIISNIISIKTSISSGNSNSVSIGNSALSSSSTIISGITNHSEEKVCYLALYHIIIIGSPDFKYNHFHQRNTQL